MNAKELLISKLLESKRQIDVIQTDIYTLENDLKFKLKDKEKLHQDINSIENALHQLDNTTIKITLSEVIEDSGIAIRLLNMEEDEQLREELHKRGLTRSDGSSYLERINYMISIDKVLLIPSTGCYTELTPTRTHSCSPTPIVFDSGIIMRISIYETYYLYEVDLMK